MKKNIILSKSNEGIVLTNIVDQTKLQDLLLLHKNELKLSSYRLISENDLPKDLGIFYDSYRLKDGYDKETNNISDFFYVDFEVAKKIWVEQYRGIREQILKSLDVEYMKALESGDVSKQNEIVSKKQQLRDITDTSKLPNDLDEIKKTWPEILGEMPDYLKSV